MTKNPELGKLQQAITEAEAMGAAGLPQLFTLSLRYAQLIETKRLPDWIGADDDDAPEGLDWDEDEDEDADWDGDGERLLEELMGDLLDTMGEIMERMMMETPLFGEIIAMTDMFQAIIKSGDIAQRPQALPQFLQLIQLIRDGLWRIDLLDKIAKSMLETGEVETAKELAALMEAAIPKVMKITRIQAQNTIAKLYLHLNEPEKARALLEDSLTKIGREGERGDAPGIEEMLDVSILMKAAGDNEHARELMALATEKIRNYQKEFWYGEMSGMLVRSAEKAALENDRETALALLELAKQDMKLGDPTFGDDLGDAWDNGPDDDDWMSMIDILESDEDLMIAMAKVLLQLGDEEAARRMTEQTLESLLRWETKDPNPRHYVAPFVELALLLNRLGSPEQAQAIMNRLFISVQTIERDCYRATPLAVIAYGWAALGKNNLAFPVLDQAIDLLLRCHEYEYNYDYFLPHGSFYLTKAMRFLKTDTRSHQYLRPTFLLAEEAEGYLEENESAIQKNRIDLLLAASDTAEDVVVTVIQESFRRASEAHPNNVWERLREFSSVFARLGVAGAMWDEAIHILIEAAQKLDQADET